MLSAKNAKITLVDFFVHCIYCTLFYLSVVTSSMSLIYVTAVDYPTA